MTELDNKTAIVTGGGQGIGQGIAFALSHEGASVVVCGRSKDILDKTVEEITGRGGQATAITCDVKDPAELTALVEATVATYGGIDILVNNVMQVPHGTLLEISEETIEAAWMSGPMASLRLMKLCHPYLRDGGAIVNVSSGVATSPGTPLRGMYSATKAALNNISRAAAVEWGPDGIRVNVIAPIAMSAAFEAFQQSEPERAQAAIAAIPLGRVGDPEGDIGRAVAFLCSPAAAFITGAIVPLDGGGSAR